MVFSVSHSYISFKESVYHLSWSNDSFTGQSRFPTSSRRNPCSRPRVVDISFTHVDALDRAQVSAGVRRVAVGEPNERRGLKRTARMAAVPAVYRSPGGGRVFRAVGADAGKRRSQPEDRRGARRGGNPDGAARSDRHAVPGARRT